MDRRHFKRMSVILHGKIIVKNTDYLVFIRNLSEKGIFVRISPNKTIANLIPESTHKLKIKISSEEVLILHGKIKWIHLDKTSSNFFMNNMGLEIINQPSEYKTFVEILQ